MSSEIQTKIGEVTGKELYSWDSKVWYSTPEAVGKGLKSENERLLAELEVKDIQIRCLSEENDGFLDVLQERFGEYIKILREQR